MSSFNGNNGQVSFDGSTVHITREGRFGEMNGNGPVNLPVSDIVAVNLKKPGAIVKGYIHFAQASNPTAPTTTQISKHPTAVIVGKKELAAAEALAAEVRAAIGG
jgi:hypothetical protein